MTTNYDPLVKTTAYTLRRRCGVVEGAHVLVAVSGGADSVAMLRALDAIKDRRRWRLTLTVGHVQHHLRQEAAEGDALFVEELARQLKLPRLRRDLDVSGIQGNVEAWARRERYRALREMASECGAGFIATAHHADDQLETLLMRMLRGTGTRGMSGIGYRVSGVGAEENDSVRPHPTPHTSHPAIIRPLLSVTRKQVLDYLNKLNQPWREDHTNADVTRWRARLRQDVLPVLEEIRPNAGRKATAFAEQMRDVHRVLNDAIEDAKRLVQHEGNERWLDRETARQLRRVVLSGLLRELLNEAGVHGDKLGVNQIGKLVRAVRDKEGGERMFAFKCGVCVVVTRERVRVVRGVGFNQI